MFCMWKLQINQQSQYFFLFRSKMFLVILLDKTNLPIDPLYNQWPATLNHDLGPKANNMFFREQVLRNLETQ